MQLLYVSGFMFEKDCGKTFALPSCTDSFFEKYLEVFDSVRVLGEPLQKCLDAHALVAMKHPDIQVEVLKPNTHPRDFKNDAEIKKILKREIANCDAMLVKPALRKGMMAIRLAQKYHKPYMIEMTGDIHNALKQNQNWMKRAYAPVLYRHIKRAIKNAPFGLYVSQEYLQSQFPIRGKMCGCSDVILKKADPEVLAKRIQRIEALPEQKTIDLALIGFYQSNMKGVDTAIRALARLPERYHLHILGNGTEENRNKWIEYGKARGVVGRIHFPKPLSSSELVLEWLDTMDAFVLPTRSEGLCRCMLEAMSRGCPSFATDICTMPELLPAECLHPLGDDEKLSEQILAVMEQSDLAKKYARINFEHAKEYDPEILKNRRNAFLAEFRSYCEEQRG